MHHKKMKRRYRRCSYVTDIGGIMNSLAELRGIGHPKQPPLNTAVNPPEINKQWFMDTIQEIFRNHPDNSMEYPFIGERIFDEPLIGFVPGDDPIFHEFKEIIGPHHFTPYEIMAWQAKKNGVPAPEPHELSVVSFIMPLTEATKKENRTMQTWPAERWAQTRLNGETFSQTFVREIVADLMGKGILAIAPDATPMFNKKRYPGVGWASPWSHRHMAYAAGLGTFGVHDFLITEKGCAHRAGSFVVNLKLSRNRKRVEDIHGFCLHYQEKGCLACAKRCPVDAISGNHGHDKEKCSHHVANSLKHCNNNYHIFIYGCGLCSTKVSCESGIPKALQKKVSPARL